MKKTLVVLICLFIVVLPVLSFSEEYGLSENEQNYIGAWVSYMVKDDVTYFFVLTFFDDMKVVMKSLRFSGSTLIVDNKASGKWCGFLSGSIILTLADGEFYGIICNDGLLSLSDYKTQEAMGVFSRCPDLSYKME